MDHSMSMDHGMDMGSGDMMTASDAFCQGDGRVMLSGFQAANGAASSCILFLFEGANVDTETKYAFAAIGAFLMGFANEMIRYGRDRMSKTNDASLGADLRRAAAFGVQMFLAYLLMLLVMLYEYVILIMIILGLAAGHFATLRLSASSRRAALESGVKTPPEVMSMSSSGPPCCCNKTTA